MYHEKLKKNSNFRTREKHGWACNQDLRVVGYHPHMVLPEELGSWRTQLQDATDQALTLIQRGWSCR